MQRRNFSCCSPWWLSCSCCAEFASKQTFLNHQQWWRHCALIQPTTYRILQIAMIAANFWICFALQVDRDLNASMRTDEKVRLRNSNWAKKWFFFFFFFFDFRRQSPMKCHCNIVAMTGKSSNYQRHRRLFTWHDSLGDVCRTRKQEKTSGRTNERHRTDLFN